MAWPVDLDVRRQRRKFFVIDDDDAVRRAQSLLVRSFGWDVRDFASAELCLAALQDERPDCLLLDLNMPGMNGVELQEMLSAQSTAIPVVAMTGNVDSTLSSRARAAGATAVLAKPFDENEFKASIECVIAG